MSMNYDIEIGPQLNISLTDITSAVEG